MLSCLRPGVLALGLALAPQASSATDLSKGHPPAVLDARVGANIRVGDDPAALPATQRGQAEPHLYRSAANPNVLLATFQEGRFAADGGAIDDGYAVSRDGGFTWTRALIPQLTLASGGPYFRATDPVAAAGPQGELYLNTLVSLDNAFGRGAVVVSRSFDSGATWSAPSVVFQSPNTQTSPDKEWIAANDFPSAPNSGRLVVTWTNFTFNAAGAATGNNLVAAVSDDRGATWSAPIALTPVGSNNQGTQPVFLPDGSLVVVYVTFISGENLFSIQCKRSTDGGRTYPAAATTVVAAVNAWNDPQLRHGSFLPSATAARQSGAIFVTYVGLVGGSPRVLVTRSTDSGATWSTPIAASDQPAGGSVINPAIAVTPDGQTVSVVFLDKRDAPDHANFIDLYAAQSFDGGQTWQPNTRLSEMSSDIRYAPLTDEGYMLGDYLGLAPALAADQPCVAIWCDTRTGDSDPMTVRFATSPTADFAAWSLARGGFALNSDTDHDGFWDGLEFASGNDPRLLESGEGLFLRLSSPTTLDIAWTQRAALDPATLRVFAPASPTIDFPNLELPADQVPAIAPPSGLVWRGRRATIPAGAAVSVARAIRFSAGLPAQIAEPVATINTDSRLVNLSTRGQVLGGASQLIGSLVTRGGARTLLVRAVGPSLSPLAPQLSVAGDPALRFSTVDGANPRVNDDWAGDAALGNTAASVGAFPLSSGRDAALLATVGPGAYSAVVSNQAAAGGNIGLVEIYDASGTADGQMVNLSTRGEVGAGDAALIAGVVIRGTQPRRVLLRAVGPSLARFNIGGALLADPVLTLYRGTTQLAQNDDWEISRSSAALAATAQRVGAFALDPASLDAALLLTLEPGIYTAVVTSADGGTGIALVEIYDAD